MSKKTTIVLPEQINERLKTAKKNKGLTKSEIIRRGTINELKKLEE